MVGLGADGRPLAVVEEAVKKIASRAAIRPYVELYIMQRIFSLSAAAHGGR